MHILSHEDEKNKGTLATLTAPCKNSRIIRSWKAMVGQVVGRMGNKQSVKRNYRRGVDLVFLLRLIGIMRPPCATWPLPALRDIEHAGRSSSEDMEAIAKESVLCP
jgi:hypothetical protein